MVCLIIDMYSCYGCQGERHNHELTQEQLTSVENVDFRDEQFFEMLTAPGDPLHQRAMYYRPFYTY